MHIRSLLPLLLAVGPGFAQGPVVMLGAQVPGQQPREDQYVKPTARDWSDQVPAPVAVERQFVANLTGHARADVVMLDGGLLLLATAPAIHRSLDILTDDRGSDLRDVVDAAALTGLGAQSGDNPAHDALAFIAPAGLGIWRRDAESGSVSVDPVAGATWSGVRYLATHPADSTAIFGLESTGTLRMATRPATSTTFIASPHQVHLSGTALGLCGIDWNGDGSTEVAAVTTTGFSVYDRTGQLLFSQAQTSQVAAASLALVRGGHGRPDTVAWLVPSLPIAPGSQVFSFAELRMRGPGVSHDQQLGIGCTAVASSDWSMDGIDDLLVSTWNNTHVDLLLNIWPIGPVFQYVPAFSLRLAVAEADAARPGNRAPVATADFDGDGDSDLVTTVTGSTHGGAKLAYVRSKQYHDVQLVPVTEVEYTADVAQNLSVFTFHCAMPPGGSHTEVLVWKETVEGDSIESTPVTRVVMERDPEAPEQQIVVALERSHLIRDDGLYRVMIRPVVLDANRRVTLAGIATLGILFATQIAQQKAMLVGGNGPTGPVRIGGIVVSDGPLPPAPPGNPPVPGGG